MLKVLALVITLSLSVQCAEGSLNKTPIEIIQCLYTSPVIAKDVSELIELIKQHEYMKLISYVIEKFPEVKQEVVKCIKEEKELELLSANERNDDDEEFDDNFYIINLYSCINCYTLKKFEKNYVKHTCRHFCYETSCIKTELCKNIQECKYWHCEH